LRKRNFRKFLIFVERRRRRRMGYDEDGMNENVKEQL